MTKILLVEDNEMNRDMLSRRLQKNGLRGSHRRRRRRGRGEGAGGGACADPDGHEPARHRRLGSHTPAEGGGSADAEDPRHRVDRSRHDGRSGQALAAGCDDFDTKPVELARLLSKIKALLGTSRPVGEHRPGALAHLRHELRTPLNHIIGYSEMLLEERGGPRPCCARAGPAHDARGMRNGCSPPSTSLGACRRGSGRCRTSGGRGVADLGAIAGDGRRAGAPGCAQSGLEGARRRPRPDRSGSRRCVPARPIAS